jgi:hypothetical protein
MEQVIKSHLRVKVESIDQFVKNHAKQCIQDTHPKTTYELFETLKMKPISFDVSDFVTNKTESVTICTVLQNWIQFLGLQLQQTPVKLSNQMLSVKIWKMFVTRMSLNPWFICSETKKSAEHGLEVLDLFMQVCKDIVYSSFIMNVSDTIRTEPVITHKVIDNLELQRFGSKPIKTQIEKPPTSRQFKTLFETTTAMPQAPSNRNWESETQSRGLVNNDTDIRLPSIEEENPMGSDSELKKIKNGIAFTPKVEKKGTLIKIQHRKVKNEGSKEKSKQKPGKPRKQKPKNSSESSDSD